MGLRKRYRNRVVTHDSSAVVNFGSLGGTVHASMFTGDNVQIQGATDGEPREGVFAQFQNETGGTAQLSLAGLSIGEVYEIRWNIVAISGQVRASVSESVFVDINSTESYSLEFTATGADNLTLYSSEFAIVTSIPIEIAKVS